MYREDLLLNNLQLMICPKTKPNQTKKLLSWIEASISLQK